MPRTFDLILTALAPVVWGSTYVVTTELLPDGYPMTAAMLRALLAGTQQANIEHSAERARARFS